MKVNIRLTRDSLAAGDDADAPHERFVLFEVSDLGTNQLVSQLTQGYLASVNGIGHSWSAFLNGELIATVDTNSVTAHTEKARFVAENELYFKYHPAAF